MDERIPQDELVVSPLDTVIVGSRVVVFREVASTNDHALSRGGDGLVIVADSQTAGRGRRGRPWHSAPGLGLWFSVVFAKPVSGLAFAGPLAVRDGIRPWCDLDVKWPNDLVHKGKKVSGLLVEGRGKWLALGIGINVKHRPEDFPEDLRDTAGSVEWAAGKPCGRADVLRAVLTALDERVMVLRSGGVAEVRREWVEACGVVGRRVRSGAVEGVVEHVDETGALVVMTGEGTRTVMFGEVVEMDEGPAVREDPDASEE